MKLTERCSGREFDTPHLHQMNMRKFEVIKVERGDGGPGPEYAFLITYKAIVKKLWSEKTLWVVAKNSIEAKQKAEDRFGDEMVSTG